MKPRTSPSSLSLVLLLGLVLLVQFGPRAVLAGRGLPLLSGDALFFVPVALQHLLYGEFSHPFWHPLQLGGGPFIWHGWLYPYLLSRLGALFSVGTVAGLQVIETLLMMVSAALFALRIARLPAPGLVKLAAMVCVVALLQAASGRPEVVVHLLLMAGLLFWPAQAPRRADALATVLLAGIAAAQPTVAFVAGIFYCTHLAFVRPTVPALGAMVGVGALSIALAAALTAVFHPLGLMAMVDGILAHSRHILTRTDGDFLTVYLLSPATPLLIAWPLLLVLAGGALARRGLLQPKSAWLFYPLLLASAYLVWNFGLRVSYTAYNISVFFPLVVYALLAGAPGMQTQRFGGPFGLALLALGAATLAAQLRLLTVLQLSARHGVAPAEVADQIRADVAAGRKVALTIPLAMADYALSRQPGVAVVHEESGGSVDGADVVYDHQALSGQRAPRPRTGFELETNRFMDGVFVAGFKVANTPVAYNYARYLRTPSPPN